MQNSGRGPSPESIAPNCTFPEARIQLNLNKPNLTRPKPPPPPNTKHPPHPTSGTPLKKLKKISTLLFLQFGALDLELGPSPVGDSEAGKLTFYDCLQLRLMHASRTIVLS